MTALGLLLPLLLGAAGPDATALSTGRLDVSVAPDGALTVRHRGTGRVYRSASPPEPPECVIRRAALRPKIDGDPGEWADVPPLRITAKMTGDLARVDDDDDCSCDLRVQWDDEGLYVAFVITDEKVVFPTEPGLRWWDHDSAELWIDAAQFGFSVNPAGGVVSRVHQSAEGCAVAVRPVVAGTLQVRDGEGPCCPAAGPAGIATGPYCLEAAIRWSAVGLAAPRVGERRRFAAGVNDADATGLREGQVYWPATWVHSQPLTFATATFADEAGRAPGSERPAARLTSDLRRVPGGLAFRRTVGLRDGRPVQADVKVTTTEDADSLLITLDLPERDAPFTNLVYPAALTTDMARGALCFCPYGDGLLVPQDDSRWANAVIAGAGDLPFAGLIDQERGDGYMVFLETPWDAIVRAARIDGKLVPQAEWLPSLGKFGEPRQVRLVFIESGGYVALAKRYRKYAQRDGWLVTLREKSQARPAIARLAGAPDVWGADGGWARWAWAAGMEHCLLNYTSSRENMQAVVDLGWLTSRYDNYVDLLEENDPAKWDSNHGSLEEVTVRADGSKQLGWLTWDKKTQYYQRCSAKMVEAAQRVMPPDLERHVYLARFLDVTTATGLDECYHPDHPHDRRQNMEQKNALFAYTNSLGVVTGGEHGRFWAVPYMDYFEGMMSGNHDFSWPAGHLLLPEQGLEGISENYRKYGIGPVYRIPLWELVFHDCVVNYWYWGDTNDYLYSLDPGITDRKDALNVLYGTPPMYWPNSTHGFPATPEGRARLMDSYRRTCRWHDAVMTEEMLSHEVLSEDRLVHRSRFSGGYVATVNFAAEPRTVEHEGKRYELPPEGFVATGPDFLLERRLLEGRVVMRIRSPRYAFVDGGGRTVSVPGLASEGRCTVFVDSDERLRVAAGGDAAFVNPTAFVAGWDLPRSRLFALNLARERERAIDIDTGRGQVPIPASGEVLELATGSETQPADLCFIGRLSVSPDQPRQGVPAVVSAEVANAGHTAVTGGRAVLAVDGRTAGEAPLDLAPGNTATVSLPLDTTQLDGPRRLTLTLMPAAGQDEQLRNNNVAEARVVFALDRAQWPAEPVATAKVTGAAVTRRDAAVTAELTLPPEVAIDSVRVVDVAEGATVPAQFEPKGEGGREGTLVWTVPGELPPGAVREFQVIGQRGEGRVLPPAGGWWREETRSIVTPVYALELADGVVRNLRILVGREPEQPVLSLLSYSSGATGWVEEKGVTEALAVLANGPVRTVVEVKRNLVDGVAIFTKRYYFYEDWFAVETTAEPSVTGLHNRAYFRRPATYEDSRGKTTSIDGKGDDDDKISGPPPEWVAVYSPDWALSLASLAETTGLTFWDSGAWGGLGYSGAPGHSVHAWVFHPGRADAGFAVEDVARLKSPPGVSWE